MSRPRVLLVTLYLSDDAKGPEQSYKMWSMLTALGACVLEEHTKAGVIQCEYFGADTKALEAIPGVAAVTSREPEVKFEPLLPVPPKAMASKVHRRSA